MSRASSFTASTTLIYSIYLEVESWTDMSETGKDEGWRLAIQKDLMLVFVTEHNLRSVLAEHAIHMPSYEFKTDRDLIGKVMVVHIFYDLDESLYHELYRSVEVLEKEELLENYEIVLDDCPIGMTVVPIGTATSRKKIL